MLRKNIGFLLKNRKFMLIIILLFFINGVLIYKSTIDENHNVDAFGDIMEWLSSTEDPIAACDEHISEILLDYKKLRFANSSYEEYLLISDVREYIMGIEGYENTLHQLIQNVQSRALFSMLEKTDRKSSVSNTLETYQALLDVKPVMGNYFAIAKFTTIGFPDAIMILIILTACTFLIIEERERGIYLLIKTTKRGRISYFLWKTGALLGITMISGLVFYFQSFVIYVSMYGCDNLHVPVQSIPGYILCPFPISITGYLILFILLKIGAFAAITVFIIFICILPVKAAVVYMLNSLMIVSSVLMYLGVDRSSKYVILKYTNFFSLFDVKSYTNRLNFVTFADKDIRILNFSLVLIITLTLVMMLFGVTAYLSYQKTWPLHLLQRKRIPLFGFHVMRNELTRFMVLQGGAVLLGVYVLSVIYLHDFKENKNETNRYFKSYVMLLNNTDHEAAVIWIDQKQIELNALEKDTNRLSLLYAEGSISQISYEQSMKFIQEQLTIKPIIEKLKNQSQYIADVREERGIDCDYIYEPLYNDMFGDEGQSTRYLNGIVIALFSVCFIIPIFAYDNQYKMERLLLVTRRGSNKLVNSRIFILLILETVLVVIMNIVWFLSLDARFTIMGLSSKLQSLNYFEKFPFPISIGSFLVLQFVLNIILIQFIGLFLIAFSMRGKELVPSLLYGTLCCVCPVVLALLGFIPAIKYWMTPFFVPNILFINSNVGVYINLVLVMLGIVIFHTKSGYRWRGKDGTKN